MLIEISHYFLIFIIYSFIGWTMETILTYIKEKKFINRGFLIGPYCPIYGWGSLLITSLLKSYTSNILASFILAMAICMILEYLTSYLMEKIFKARWWDYTDKKFNINGRVCLETAIPFGLGALLILYVLHPFIINILGIFDYKIYLLISIILFTLFLIDNIISFNIISKFKKLELKERKDNTEEITKKIKEYLSINSKLGKRLMNAFPNVQASIKSIRLKQKELKRELNIKQKKLKEEFFNKQRELKKELAIKEEHLKKRKK